MSQERLLGPEFLVHQRDEQADEAYYQRDKSLGAVPLILRSAPGHGDEERSRRSCEEERPEPVDARQSLAKRRLSRLQGQQIGDGDETERQEGEHQVEDPAPRRAVDYGASDYGAEC